MSHYGVISMGIRCPIIREGDNLQQIVLDSILRTTSLEDKDVIGITESVVARAQGNYVAVDEIAQETERLFGKDPVIILDKPIYSRNRFSMILKGIARAAKKIYLVMPDFDEVGNPKGTNPWTGVDIEQYYREICEKEHCTCCINPKLFFDEDIQYLNCSLRPNNFISKQGEHCLKDYFPDKCEWGLLGSNKANEEKLKLFPNVEKAKELVNSIQATIKERLNITVSVLVYGDGCFKDPSSGIYEFADPVASVAYTAELLGSPNEIKLKAFADDQFKDLNGLDLSNAIKQEIRNKKDLKGKMASEGTTPRRYIDLLPSLMDLTSGSGDKGTPVVLVKHYFDNYAC